MQLFLEEMIEKGEVNFPKFELGNFDDIFRIGGADLSRRAQFGIRKKRALTIRLFLCRSNKRQTDITKE